jgi:hypothetical protein
MTFAFNGPDGWIEIAGDVLLPAYGDHPATMVNELLGPTLSPEARAERGLAEVVEIARPVGVNVTGCAVVDVGGVPTRQYTHEDLSSDDLAALIQRQNDRIDAQAGQVIAGEYPLWKQQNMIARAVALLDIKSQRDLTTEEATEQTALRAAWAWVDAVRAHSETLKAALPSDGPGAAAFDVTTGWPAA